MNSNQKIRRKGKLRAPNSTICCRINSIQNLNSIAIALGPERTRTELLPYITELLDDDAEVLAELATVLGAMLDYIGGYHFCEHIFGPLEKLCLIEESLVRDRAAESIIKILGRLKQ
jgi:serine/threonine-protein phosphatase 2A regulatory subunit A